MPLNFEQSPDFHASFMIYFVAAIVKNARSQNVLLNID
jgi:hypothetical protein